MTKTPRTPHKKTLYIKRIQGGTPPPAEVRPRKQSIDFLIKVFLFLFWSCPRAHRGAGRPWKLPLNGATDFVSKPKITSLQSVLCQISFLFLTESPKTPQEMFKWGLKIFLSFQTSTLFFFFIKSWSISHQTNAGKGYNSKPNSKRGKN